MFESWENIRKNEKYERETLGINMLGGGFKHLFFSPLPGEDSHFDQYFSDGLKPPTSMHRMLELCQKFE